MAFGLGKLVKGAARVGVGAAVGFATGGPAGAIAGGATAGLGYLSSQKQKKASQEAQRLQRIQQRREKILQIREARKKRADVEQTGANLGVSGSSGILGASTSIGSQLDSNLGFINEYGTITERVGSLLNQSQSFSNLSKLVGGVADQYIEAQKIFKTADAAGIDRSDVHTGTIFDMVY